MAPLLKDEKGRCERPKSKDHKCFQMRWPNLHGVERMETSIHSRDHSMMKKWRINDHLYKFITERSPSMFWPIPLSHLYYKIKGTLAIWQIKYFILVRKLMICRAVTWNPTLQNALWMYYSSVSCLFVGWWFLGQWHETLTLQNALCMHYYYQIFDCVLSFCGRVKVFRLKS